MAEEQKPAEQSSGTNVGAGAGAGNGASSTSEPQAEQAQAEQQQPEQAQGAAGAGSESGDVTGETSGTGVGENQTENGETETEPEELDPLTVMTAERDEYLDALQRLKAEFANARRRAEENAANQRAQAAAALVEKILPVLDSCDAAFSQGIEEVRPIYSALVDVLKAEGLERIDQASEPFDPEVHEAVLFEPAEEQDETQIVAEVMRAGYSWNGRVLRAAMVKVRG